MSSVSAYKLVIWRDASLPFSLGSYLVTGEQRDSPSPLSVFRNWMPQGMSDAGTRVNVFEVKGSTVGVGQLAVVLSNGRFMQEIQDCIYVHNPCLLTPTYADTC